MPKKSSSNEATIIERSLPIPSPSGKFKALISSRTSEAGDISQAYVVSNVGGSGLVAIMAPRVPMAFEWKSDEELVVSYPNDRPSPRINATNTSFGYGGRGKVTYKAIDPSTLPRIRWIREGEVAVKARHSLDRGELIEIEQNGETSFSYSYDDVNEADSSAAMLQARGFQSGGYSWAGIVFGLLSVHNRDMLDEIEFDPESDGLVVQSKNRNFLVRVAELIAAAKHDATLLDLAIERATSEGEME